MNTPSQHSCLSARIDEVGEAVTQLWGTSHEAEKLHAELNVFRREAREIIEKRGLRSMIIAVVGSKNSGKSWLCRALINDASQHDRVPSGTSRENGTVKLMWIGEGLPADLDPEFEISLPLSPDKLFDLGRPYVLLDVPGHNEADDRRREVALRSITQASLRIAMFSWDSKDDESNDVFLTAGDGATILPLIVDHQHPRPQQDSRPELDSLRQRLRRRCPRSEVLPPVLIPGFAHRENKSSVCQEAATLAREAARQAVAALVENPEAMLNARLDALRGRMRSFTGPVVSRIATPLERLEQAEKKAADEVLNLLVGSSGDLQRTVRFRMLWRTAGSLHPALFPFRGFMTLFALAAGAFDRLAFAMMGSVPSLAMCSFQALRNLRSLAKPDSKLDEELSLRATNLITREISPALHAFHQAARSALPASNEGVLHHARTDIQISGMDVLRSRSSQIFEDAVQASVSRRPAVFLGFTATLLFCLLAAGPLWALYQSFFLAWSASFNGIDTSIWQTFPIPAPGYVFGNLLMTMLPVIVLAFIATLVCAGKKRLHKCATRIAHDHLVLIQELTSWDQVFFTNQDPVRRAVKTLVNFQEGSSPKPPFPTIQS